MKQTYNNNNQDDKTIVSVDIGATSGRVMTAKMIAGKYEYTEVHRFLNKLIKDGNHLYWDMNYLIGEIEKALTKIRNFSSLGISTWGCDICLIDKSGSLIRNPLCYRDECFVKMDQELFSQIDYEEVYQITGIQRLPFNTFTQLAYLKSKEPDIYQQIDKVLMIPDYIAYYFTGQMFLEETNASTSGCYDYQKKKMSDILLEKIKIDKNIFPKLIYPREAYGVMKDEVAQKLGINQAKVIACCTHDTGSAILGSLANVDVAYISSGTWSLMGTLLDKQIKNKDSYLANFTNEIGYNHQIRYLKNIMGMWILEEYRKELIENSLDASFEVIIQDLKKPHSSITYIDPDDELFIAPGVMSKRISEFAKITKQKEPSSRSEIIQTIYYSLVLKYKVVYEKLQSITKKDFKYLTIIGGGSKNEILCQMVADLLAVDVLAGPSEATVLGNIFVQLMASDTIGVNDISQLLKDNENIKIFKSKSDVLALSQTSWQSEYQKFKKILEVRNGRC